MKRTLTISLDFDWCYRHLGIKVLAMLASKIETIHQYGTHIGHRGTTHQYASYSTTSDPTATGKKPGLPAIWPC